MAETDPTAVPQPMTSTSPRTLTYYHAGPLFNLADLTANVSLSQLISSLTENEKFQNTGGYHFQPVLPQDLEPRSLHPHSIRDSDLRALLSTDLALFVYDGADLEPGTVIEYLVAKFADIPCVILRTDFRGGGDQHQIPPPDSSAGVASNEGKEGKVGKESAKSDAWNLMSSFWPRTRTVSIDSMSVYKSALATEFAHPQLEFGSDTQRSSNASLAASTTLLQHTAGHVIKALNEVVRIPPRLPVHLREGVYEWLSLMVGWRDDDEGDGEGRRRVGEELRRVLEGKIGRGML